MYTLLARTLLHEIHQCRLVLGLTGAKITKSYWYIVGWAMIVVHY